MQITWPPEDAPLLCVLAGQQVTIDCVEMMQPST